MGESSFYPYVNFVSTQNPDCRAIYSRVSAALFLVDLCRDGRAVPWKLLATYAADEGLFSDEELAALKQAPKADLHRDKSQCDEGLTSLDLLWRIAESFGVAGNVAQAVSGKESVTSVADALCDILA